MGILNGKVCIVTGGGGSLGLASAELLLSEGGRVMLVDEKQASLDRAVGSLKYGPDIVGAIKADVSNSRDTQTYINSDGDEMGKDRCPFQQCGLERRHKTHHRVSRGGFRCRHGRQRSGILSRL